MTARRKNDLDDKPMPPTLFDGKEEHADADGVQPLSPVVNASAKKVSKPRVARQDIRAIQDLLWKEALLAAHEVDRFESEEAFQDHLRQHLPQNSLETRTRYAQTLIRWFFPDGVRGLAASVWINYRDEGLLEETLRFLYLSVEPMVAAAVAEALFPIAENAQIPPSYLTNFIRQRFGEETPEKSIKRVKQNLRKLGILVREKGDRDTLRALSPSSTGFLVLLHYVFARNEPCAVEFRTLVHNLFWKFLGFKSEDQLRAIIKESLNRALISKYVVADRIESISFRFSFNDFVTNRMKL
jgi:hypothetical protein